MKANRSDNTDRHPSSSIHLRPAAVHLCCLTSDPAPPSPCYCSAGRGHAGLLSHNPRHPRVSNRSRDHRHPSDVTGFLFVCLYFVSIFVSLRRPSADVGPQCPFVRNIWLPVVIAWWLAAGLELERGRSFLVFNNQLKKSFMLQRSVKRRHVRPAGTATRGGAQGGVVGVGGLRVVSSDCVTCLFPSGQPPPCGGQHGQPGHAPLREFTLVLLLLH